MSIDPAALAAAIAKAQNKAQSTTISIPSDKTLQERIHSLAQYVSKNGIQLEGVVRSKQRDNSDFRFLFDQQSEEFIYYSHVRDSLLAGHSLEDIISSMANAKLEAFRVNLSQLNGSKESVEASSGCILSNWNYIDQYCDELETSMANSYFKQQLMIFYVLNDVVFKAKQKALVELLTKISSRVPVLINLLRIEEPSQSEKVSQLLNLWESKEVFSHGVMESLKSSLPTIQPPAQQQQQVEQQATQQQEQQQQQQMPQTIGQNPPVSAATPVRTSRFGQQPPPHQQSQQQTNPAVIQQQQQQPAMGQQLQQNVPWRQPAQQPPQQVPNFQQPAPMGFPAPSQRGFQQQPLQPMTGIAPMTQVPPVQVQPPMMPAGQVMPIQKPLMCLGQPLPQPMTMDPYQMPVGMMVRFLERAKIAGTREYEPINPQQIGWGTPPIPDGNHTKKALDDFNKRMQSLSTDSKNDSDRDSRDRHHHSHHRNRTRSRSPPRRSRSRSRSPPPRKAPKFTKASSNFSDKPATQSVASTIAAVASNSQSISQPPANMTPSKPKKRFGFAPPPTAAAGGTPNMAQVPPQRQAFIPPQPVQPAAAVDPMAEAIKRAQMAAAAMAASMRR